MFADPIPDNDRKWTDDYGQTLVHVHQGSQCKGRHCPIHNPSDKAEAIGLRYWRGDRGLMERVCKHAVGHPDPDHMAYVRLAFGDDVANVEDIHGCDGCCS